ncbi:MAG TPA: hypothetical protein VM598_13605 [Bdellovibrionota bacterium]|nr:hypothetical protein [Bdellovibrionota bacterium]
MKTRAALALSFGIYALPIVGPHTFAFVGEFLLKGKGPWAPWYWAAALAVQALVFGFLRLVFSRPATKYVGFLALPASWFALAWLFMIVIPTAMLVEDDPAPELTGLPETCAIDGWWLADPLPHALAGPAPKSVLVTDSKGNPGVFRVKDCAVVALKPPPLPEGASLRVAELLEGGSYIYGTIVRGAAGPDFGFFDPAKATGFPIPVPFSKTAYPNTPYFSRDGRFVAWMEHPDGANLRVRGGPAAKPEGIDFDPVQNGPASYSVEDVAAGGKEILVSKNFEFLLFDAKGSLIWRLQPEFAPSVGSIRILPDGKSYLAWEIIPSQDEARCRVLWKMNDDLVLKEIPKGSCVTSSAVSSDWKWIAASTTRSVSVGRIDDTVVIWSWKGEEIFRKRLRAYNRTPVHFLAGNLFAYSEIDEKGKGRTIVLRLPDLSGP